MRRVVLLLVGLLALAGVAVASSGGATQAQPRWVIRDLGTLGGAESEAVAINERRQVVGWAETKASVDGRPVRHAFLWESGKLRDLGVLPGKRYSLPTAINGSGQVVGMSFANYDEKGNAISPRAFLWERGRLRDLTPRNFQESMAVRVNDSGQVLIQAYSRTNFRAFLWQRGRFTDLGRSYVRFIKNHGINNRGQVVFTRPYGDPREADTACLWQRGKVTTLGTLPGDDHSSVRALNNHGQIIGSSFGKDGEEHAFLWQKGRMTALGHLGLGASTPEAINERGQVVGHSFAAVGDMRGFLWRRGTMLSLGTRSRGLMDAVAINESGQVVGTSTSYRALLWEHGRVVDLGTLPGKKYSDALGINNRGNIIGVSSWSGWGTKNENPAGHAVLWTLKR